VFFATDEVVRHLIPVPFVLLGLAIARWPEGLAAFYAKVFDDLGVQSYSRAYGSDTGAHFIRAVGVLFALIGAYWTVVGTG
jgi:hypothetical protein